MVNPLRTVAILIPFALTLSAQVPSTRLVYVSVTDPLGRFVTGLDKDHFTIVENDVQRQITGFSDVDSSIAIAIVSDVPLQAAPDLLIQARSVSDALQQLASSKSIRKALISTGAAITQSTPAGIQVVQAKPDDLDKVLREIRNEYLLTFDSAETGANIAVVMNPPRGLPPLRATSK